MRRTFKHDSGAKMLNASWRHRRRLRFYKFFLQLRIYPLFRLLPVLWLLLCYCCCCCHCADRRHIEEQNVKPNNCYDMRYGFDGALTSAAPIPRLPTVNSTNGVNGSTVSSTNLSAAASDPWMRHQLQLQSGADTNAHGIRPGWQCCCWNATNQVSVSKLFVKFYDKGQVSCDEIICCGYKILHVHISTYRVRHLYVVNRNVE